MGLVALLTLQARWSDAYLLLVLFVVCTLVYVGSILTIGSAVSPNFRILAVIAFVGSEAWVATFARGLSPIPVWFLGAIALLAVLFLVYEREFRHRTAEGPIEKSPPG